MCCDHIIGKLKTEGLKVFETSFHSDVLATDDYIRIVEESLKSKDESLEIEEIIKLFESEWHNIDIFYIDDTNDKISKHGRLTKAMITFANRHNKLILLNANKSPYENGFLQLDLLSHVDVLEVLGQDYRQTHSWHNGIEGSN